jgi:prolipoprotein diacylglyceryl transferase
MPFVHDFSPILLEIGPLKIHWYGLLYAVGLAVNYSILSYIFKREGKSQKMLESLVIYLFIGLVLGSRLGHVFFYDWAYYSQNLTEILMVWKGGLASHGGAIGLFLGFFAWSKRYKQRMRDYLGLIVIPMGFTAALIRIGNFMNAEILGTITESSFGVIFPGEEEARHPVQLYSALINFTIFTDLMVLYYIVSSREKSGQAKKSNKLWFFFLFLFIYFSARFAVEYFKDLQDPLPVDFALSMGQLLSIPGILIGLAGFFITKARADHYDT